MRADGKIILWALIFTLQSDVYNVMLLYEIRGFLQRTTWERQDTDLQPLEIRVRGKVMQVTTSASIYRDELLVQFHECCQMAGRPKKYSSTTSRELPELLPSWAAVTSFLTHRCTWKFNTRVCLCGVVKQTLLWKLQKPESTHKLIFVVFKTKIICGIQNDQAIKKNRMWWRVVRYQKKKLRAPQSFTTTNMEATYASRKLLTIYQIPWRQIPGTIILNHHHKNPKIAKRSAITSWFTFILLPFPQYISHLLLYLPSDLLRSFLTNILWHSLYHLS